MKVSERFGQSSHTVAWLREDKMAIILMRQLLFLAVQNSHNLFLALPFKTT